MQPHIRAFVERAVTFTDLSRVRGHPAGAGGAVVQDRRHQHRRRLRHADQRPGRVGPRAGRAVGGAAAGFAAGHPRLVRRDRPGLPVAEPAVGHAVRRRGAADQDDPAPGVVADRRHLRVRRTDHRAAPARRPAHERPAAAAARQGQHRAGGRAQARDDRDRRPRRRPRPGRRLGRRRVCFEGTVADLRTSDTLTGRHLDDRASVKPTVRTPSGALEIRGASHQQPAERRRRHSARRAGGGHRRGRLGQEFADPRLGSARRAGVCLDRPGPIKGSRRSNPATYTGLLEPDPQGVRQGQRGEAGAVQRQLRGCLPGLQRRRGDLHRPGDDGRGGHHLRGVRGQAVPGGGAGVHLRRPQHRRGAGDAGQRGG